MSLPIYKNVQECRYDILSLGEVMLRLDPGEGRIHTARTFQAWEGGGEYNVARGLRRCFGLRAAVVTAFADNPVGRLLEDLIMQGGVDTSLIQWMPYDGIGRTLRNGLNFTERGFGIRGAKGCSDRGNTAVSQLKTGMIDWEYIFGTLYRFSFLTFLRLSAVKYGTFSFSPFFCFLMLFIYKKAKGVPCLALRIF